MKVSRVVLELTTLAVKATWKSQYSSRFWYSRVWYSSSSRSYWKVVNVITLVLKTSRKSQIPMEVMTLALIVNWRSYIFGRVLQCLRKIFVHCCIYCSICTSNMLSFISFDNIFICLEKFYTIRIKRGIW